MNPYYLFRLFVVCCLLVVPARAYGGSFRAGVAAVNVSPPTLPVIQNGGFIESTLSKVEDPLFARAFVFDDGTERLAIVVVDSCMLPRILCDQAKAQASTKTGLRADRMMISATHTHTAPSVMDFCLGSRQDPRYTRFLPGKIAEAISLAYERLQPAQVAWAKIDAGRFTSNRRWITRPDKMGVDPFGEKTVRAMMHPGHANPDYLGPSGPIDPWLSLLSIQTSSGAPLGVLANFSMHYFGGHPGVSADYYGAFARQFAQRLAPSSDRFVAAMSQGTSGDLWWGDYSLPKRQEWSMEEFTAGIVDKAIGAVDGLVYQRELSMAMAERRTTMERRLPNEDRLSWAREKLAAMNGRRPKTRPEVYAEQARFIEENPAEEIVLQALRIGDLGIVGMPNEVYALTGLKIKALSPLGLTFNVELANGAAGYIPPPEQHALGGYTTWPARTAGLEVEAEPKIVAMIGDLLKQVAQKPLRRYREPGGSYAAVVKASKPIYRWRMGEQQRQFAAPSVEAKARYEGDVAFHLPGIEGKAFGDAYESRSVQFAGGRLVVPGLVLTPNYSVEFWFNSALLPSTVKESATLYDWGGDRLQISGSTTETTGRLQLGGRVGRTPIKSKQWNHVVLVREADRVRVYLNGVMAPELEVEAVKDLSRNSLCLAGAWDGEDRFEGRIDEVALFSRSLMSAEIRQHFRAAEREESAALSPADSMAQIHVRDGYTIELVAAEPLVMDPVAIDWGSDGRLWVAEMADYPYGIDGQGKPGGRIRWLRDVDRDGRYDQSQVFLDGINFPTSVMPWRNGVLVTAAPEVFFAEDTNGDGRADRKEVIFQGFMEGNQQLRLNCLRWGLDGWIYCASGGHHAGFGAQNRIDGIRSKDSYRLGSRDFRFQPDTGSLVPLSGPSQFGRVRDDWGHWFGVQNSYPLWHYVLPDPYLQRNQHVSYPDPRVQLRGDPNPKVFMNKPVQKRYHSYEQSSRFTSACGPSIYRDGLLFSDEPGVTHAFTCEPFHNVVQHHVLTDANVSFQGRRAIEDGETDFMASADRWSRPVMTRTGPDGALYVVDMYRYMIEHPDWLPPEGKEELRPFYRSGEERGRIYRIYPSGARSDGGAALSNGEAYGFLDGLRSSNGRVRDLAQQQIIEDQLISLVPQLTAMLQDEQSARTRLQAMATIYGLNQLNESHLLVALGDPVGQVRRQGIRFSEEVALNSESLISRLAGMADDPDDRVRLQLAFTLGELGGDDVLASLVRLAKDGRDDPMMVAAIMSSAAEHFESLLESLLSIPQYAEHLARMAAALPERYGAMGQALVASEETPWLALADWIDALEVGGHQWNDRIESSNLVSPTLQAALKDRVMMASRLARSSEPVAYIRAELFSLLGRISEQRNRDVTFLLAQTNPRKEKVIRGAAISNLRRFDDVTVAESLLGRWREQLPEDRNQILDLLLGRRVWTQELVSALEEGVIQTSELNASRRQRLRRHADKELGVRATRLFQHDESRSTHEEMLAYRSALTMDGNPTLGKEHFEMRCGLCHRLAGLGQTIGPDLRSVSDRTPQYFLSSILQPNLATEPKYLGYEIVLADGVTLYGMVERETAGALIIRFLDGSERSIQKSAIQRLQSGNASFMPEGLAEGMGAEDMADLIAFLVVSTSL
ncbi:c-type cytochrome [Verrucomicrobia bacterium]|nr:c-type cytochrome [Verrucomicrobiota bacterium]